jgi:peroxiredoxin
MRRNVIMRSFIPLLLVIAFIISTLAGCGAPQQACPKIGDKAPDFTLPGLDGKSISLSSFAGKPVIINTWSISCIECKREMPYFNDVGKQYRIQGLIILSVNTMDSSGTIKDFLAKNDYSFTTVIDLKNEIYKKFCCPKNADPNTFFISTDGTIKSIKIGGFVAKDDLITEVKKIIK